jgi:hypothetical protein
VQYNDDKIRKLSSEINTALSLLEELSKTGENEFISDPHKISSLLLLGHRECLLP